jgi:hypothetical protein
MVEAAETDGEVFRASFLAVVIRTGLYAAGDFDFFVVLSLFTLMVY